MLDRRAFVAAALGALAVIAMPAVAWTQERPMPTVEEVHFDPAVPVLGNPDGDITIVEFFDYQCPYCKRDWPGVLKAVQDDGNVRLVMRDWPILGDNSVYAARLALAAHQSGDYEKAAGALMATEGRLDKRKIDAALRDAGLDPVALNAAFEADPSRIDAILMRAEMMGDAFDFIGTPSFIVGTHLYRGVMDGPGITEAIARARE